MQNRETFGRTVISQPAKLVAVAPMMAYTDRHCRYLHRLYSPSALLFTEMVSTNALLFGEQWHQLDYHPAEHPVALQLGGSNPADLAKCTVIAAARGYDEVNLNVGCPSPRVQRGAFGACLMRDPELVARCVTAMRNAADLRVSVKCRLGVDDDDSTEFLHRFVSLVANSGCTRFYVHARKAILGGLSPAQNRSIPPLQYSRVEHLKATYPHLEIIVNGGIAHWPDIEPLLQWADGVMLGRGAYNDPRVLSECHRRLLDPAFTSATQDILADYQAYALNQVAQQARLGHITRHAVHCCVNVPGARRFRRVLSDAARLKHNDVSIFEDALAEVNLPPPARTAPTVTTVPAGA